MDNIVQQFSFLSDNDYWNAFYEQKKESISQESRFSHFIQKYIKKGKTLVDIGCGNGRDSIFFNNLGLNVIGIDGSTTAINLLEGKKNDSLSFILGNFTNDSRIFNTTIDYYYSRFTLHAINESDEDVLLNNIANNLKQNGYFFLEVRSIHDEKFGKGIPAGKNTFILDGHHRRFLDINELKNKLEKLNFSIKYAEEKKDFAPFSNENSPIIRIIAKKKGFCIICRRNNVELSDEHIIPDALGGAIHSYQVCHECNSKLGKFVDPILTENLLLQFNRSYLQIPGKSGHVPNPFVDNPVIASDNNKYQMNIVNGKIVPKLLPKIKKDLSTNTFEIIVDETDINKIDSIADKIVNRSKLKDAKISSIKKMITKPSPEFKISSIMDIDKIKLGLLKIAYEYTIENIPEYLDDTEAKKISKILNSTDDSRINELVIRGEIFGKGITKKLDSFIDTTNKDKHILALYSVNESLWCFVRLFNSISLEFRMSEKKYITPDNDVITINDIKKKHAENMSIKDLVKRTIRLYDIIVICKDTRLYRKNVELNEKGNILAYNSSNKNLGELDKFASKKIIEGSEKITENTYTTDHNVSGLLFVKEKNNLKYHQILKIKLISKISKI